MSRKPSNFRQADVSRAVKALKAAGIDILRVELDAGKVTLIIGENAKKKEESNPFRTAPVFDPMVRQRKKKQPPVALVHSTKKE